MAQQTYNNNIKHNHSYDGILRSRSGGYSIPLFCHLFMMSDTNNQNSCIQKPCQSNQSGYHNTELEDRNPNLSERPVLYTGVLWIGILRRFLIPQPVTDSRPCCPPKSGVKPEAKEMALVKPTNTSSGSYIQPSPHVITKPQDHREQGQLRRQESKHSPLATLVYQIQEASKVLKDEAQHFSDDLSELVQDGKATTSEKLQTLREGEAAAGRYATITITSLLGYMAGMRRSVAVRLVYAATGAVATATLCYPEEARHYNNHALALISQGVSFSVQLLRYGPQKTLAIKELIQQQISMPRSMEQSTKNSNTKPSPEMETTSKINDNAVSQENSSDRFEHKEKENHFKSSNSEDSTLQQKLLFLEQQEMSPIGSQFDAHGRKLSRECQRDRTRVVPYSPALPVPPKIEPDYFQHSNTYDAYQNVPKTRPADSLGTNLKEKAESCPNSLHDSYSSLQVNTSRSEHKTSKPNNTNPTEPSDITSALEPIKEAKTDSSKNENQFKGQNYPLNKKLSRYYVQNKNDTYDSTGAENDDKHSKRKRKTINCN